MDKNEKNDPTTAAEEKQEKKKAPKGMKARLTTEEMVDIGIMALRQAVTTAEILGTIVSEYLATVKKESEVKAKSKSK